MTTETPLTVQELMQILSSPSCPIEIADDLVQHFSLWIPAENEDRIEIFQEALQIALPERASHEGIPGLITLQKAQNCSRGSLVNAVEDRLHHLAQDAD